MPKENQIRANFDGQTIVVYQAYSPAIAGAALQEGKFVAPFSFTRMTWIKPSFLWLMERSNWAQKAGQECILAVRITRAGWDAALAQGVLTSYENRVHQSAAAWREEFENALVHVQWDPERSIRGADLGFNSIQVGLSRHVIRNYVDEWIVGIEDFTPLVRKIHALIEGGNTDRARKLLPSEHIYPVLPATAQRLGMD